MKYLLRSTVILVAIISSIGFVHGQSVLVTSDTSNISPDPSAVLDVRSTERGLLIPRMTTAQRTAVANPAAGLLVFDTSNDRFYFRDSTEWKSLANHEDVIWTKVADLVSNGNGTYGSDDFLFGGPTMEYDGLVPHRARMMFDKSLAAVRMGNIFNDNWDTDSIGFGSFAAGQNTIAQGNSSVSMGFENTARGAAAVALGKWTQASQSQAFAMGLLTVASGPFAMALGQETEANNNAATAIGYRTLASGPASTAMGSNTVASGNRAVAMGEQSTASGSYSTSMGHRTMATQNFATAFGDSARANAVAATAMGQYTRANATAATAIGSYTTASGVHATAMGSGTTASGVHATAMGSGTTAGGLNSMAMGSNSIANGSEATAMGNQTNANGPQSTAMGSQTSATGIRSTAMGELTTATSNAATAMGFRTLASHHASTAMGGDTWASGNRSTAMGESTHAAGSYSSTIGIGTVARGYATTTIGMYNDSLITTTEGVVSDTTALLIIGNGDSDVSRSNAMVVRKDGKVGIGTSNPTSKLHVQSSHIFTSNNYGFFSRNGTNDGIGAGFDTDPDDGLILYAGGSPSMWIQNDGRVSFGTSSVAAGFDVSVDGKIICEGLRILLKADWPDYVFGDDFDVMQIDQVKSFIEKNAHLPSFSPAHEVEGTGLDIEVVTVQQQEWIEVQTMHIIELNDRLKALEQIVKEQSRLLEVYAGQLSNTNK